MWHHTPRGGFSPAHRGRKHLLDWTMYSGKTPSRTIFCSWYMSSMNRFRARDPLLEPRFDGPPFARLDDPRHDVERPDLLRARLVAVDVERDPHLQQRLIGGPLPPDEFAVDERPQAAGQQLGRRPRVPLLVEHLVVKALGVVGGPRGTACAEFTGD